MGRKYNLIVFGASGFTGKYVVEEIAKLLKDKKIGDFTWAVAGRSEEKLKDVLKEVSDFTGYDVTNIDIILVDVAKTPSIHEMCKQGNVILNCVGPYRFYGEQVVTACIAEGTHHVDISGEPQFLERMQLLYHEQAKEKGVYIVGACGFDSIPTDLGVAFLKSKFNGDVNSVEMYMGFESTGKGTKVHYGTWQSAIYGLAHARELRPIREQLFPEPLPKPKFKLAPRALLHFSDVVKGWCLPFPGSDKSIVMRSERHFYETEKTRPIQMNAYVRQNGLISSVLLMIGAVIFGVMAQFKVGRYLLETFPRFFSVGTFSHEGPTREEADVPFSVTLVGEGWKEKLAEPTDQHSEPPNKKIIVKVSGRNPGYGVTCIALIQSGLTILKESDKMPDNGGVYTTAAAFSKTQIIENLNKTGLTYTVEKEE